MRDEAGWLAMYTLVALGALTVCAVAAAAIAGVTTGSWTRQVDAILRAAGL